MNSIERHQKRYERRKLSRQNKKIKYQNKCGDYKFVCSQEQLEKAFYECRKGVRWKATVQKFRLHIFSRTLFLSKWLMLKTWHSSGFNEFDIIERGHLRHILSVDISERCIQRSICDNYLVPLLSRPLIYDNGATIKGKGISFGLNRFKTHLEKYIRKNGANGYIYFFDFSSYFANIDNDHLLQLASKYLPDTELNELYAKFIKAFGEFGLGLGSQVSQISAVFYPNAIDHYIKEKLKVKYYGRYMDDGYALFEKIDDAIKFGNDLLKQCSLYGISINKKKSRIVAINRNFVFLKQRYFIYKQKIIARPSRIVYKKERKRLKKYKKLLMENRISSYEILLNFHSWLCIYYNRNNFFSLLNMIKYYNSLFDNKYHVIKIKSRKEKVLNYMANRVIAEGFII